MDKLDIIGKVASILHDERRKNRKINGECEPMLEKTGDNEWIERYWTNVVDIANTEFEDLPKDWKYENLEAAKVVVELVYDRVKKWDKITQEMIEEMSNIVHIKRLKRNWEGGSFENQRVSYKKLSEEEKAKDRVQIEVAIRVINESKE